MNEITWKYYLFITTEPLSRSRPIHY